MAESIRKRLRAAAKRAIRGRRPLRRCPESVGQFIFIGGLHRSGTTLLHRLLRSDQNLTFFSNTGFFEDEGEHLQSALPSNQVLGGPGRFAFDDRAHLTEASAFATDAVRDQILREWGAYLDLTKPRILEKSPTNIARARLLQQFFPDAIFLFIVRHPIAVSLATVKWSKNSFYELLLHWNLAHTYLLEDMRHLRQSVVVRYEDLVQWTADDVKRVCASFDLHPDPSLADVRKDVNARYFKKWNEIKDLDKNCLSELKMDHICRQFGYVLEPPYVTSLGE